MGILQAILEGVALRFALVADVILSKYPDVREIIASGGVLTRAPYLAQMISDAIGRPITTCGETEASSRGAAIIALKSIGEIAHYGDAEPPSGRIVKPNPERHEILRKALARQQELYTRLA